MRESTGMFWENEPFSLKASYSAIFSLLVAVNSTFATKEARIIVSRGAVDLLVASSAHSLPPEEIAPVAIDGAVSSGIVIDGLAVGRLELVGLSRAVRREELALFADTVAQLLAQHNVTFVGENISEQTSTQAGASAAEGAQHHFLEKVIESFPGILLVVGPPPDFALRFINSRAADLLPKSLRAIGTNLGAYISGLAMRSPVAGVRTAAEIFHHAYTSGEPITYDKYEVNDAAGNASYWTWSIVPVSQPDTSHNDSLLVIAHDITDLVVERQRSQKAAREARTRADELEATFNQMADGVAIFNSEGERLRINTAAAKFLARASEGESGKTAPAYGENYVFYSPAGERYDPENRPGARAARGEVITGEEVHVRWPDGEEAILEISASPLYDNTGNVTGSVSVFHDITREKLIERMKDEFLAVVSHELRTPLSAVLGYSDLMLRGVHGPLTDRQARALAAVRTNARRLLHLINDVIDVSKLDAGGLPIEIGAINLSALVTQIVAGIYVPAKEAGIKLNNHLPSDFWVRADMRRLQQVLENLLSNAIKFTAPGGTVTISGFTSELAASDPALLQADSRQLTTDQTIAQSAIICVTDTGGGLSGDQVQRIWGRFYQADGSPKRKTGGTGLGLTIVKGLLELHGGHVWAESAGTSLGSTFSFSLPLAGSERPALTASPQEAVPGIPVQRSPRAGKSKGLVLVAEDDADQREIICEMLELEGFEVALASDGEEALQLAVRLRPAALALDVLLPRKDGWEVLSQLKSDPETQDIPVMLVSVLDQQAFGRKMGADEYLLKPVEPRVLRAALRRIMGRGGRPSRKHA